MSYAGLFTNNGLPLGLGSIMAFGNPNISLFEDVAALFANGEQGAWYDPSDTSTMYQDSQGTTPVTAIAQPVGLILDKSKGLTLGPELISNGGFATDTVWTKGIGWTIGSGNAQAATPLGAAAISQAEAIVSGRPYQITFNVVSISAGSVTLQFTGTGTQSGPTFTTTGLKTCILIANANYTTFGVLAAIGTIATIDDVSAKELPGNHAFQTTTTKRPLYQSAGRYSYLAFDGVDDALVTNSIDFTSTDKMTVWAGVRKLSDAAAARIVNLNGTLNGSIRVVGPYFADASFGAASKGTIDSGVSVLGNAAPKTAVLTVQSNISQPLIGIRVNSAASVNVITSQGAGMYSNAPLYIGGASTDTNPFNGNLYSLIVRGAQSSDAQIASTEQYVNGKTGAY